MFPLLLLNKSIKALTDQDPVLATVRRFVKQGWPKPVQQEFHPYHSRKLELSIRVMGKSYSSPNAWKRKVTLFIA